VFTYTDDWWKRTDEIYEPVRIGQGLDAAGALQAAPMERALETVDREGDRGLLERRLVELG
jgi:exopolyphosphatase/guanosine-5'-triphosphate,3'-diphosphate pyrophosphatase